MQMPTQKGMPSARFLTMVVAMAIVPQAYAKDIIVGTPPWQYKFATDSMLLLPSAVDMSKTQANMRGHALTLDTKRSDFYFEYVVKQADLNNATHNVVKFVKSANGSYVGVMTNSNPILAQREPHGIKYELDAADGGKEYLYHTNNGWNDSYGEDIGKNGWDDPNPHTFVAKTGLDSSNILWQTFLDADWAKKNNYTKYGRTRLTDVIPLPGTDYLLVTDGYGSSYVHVLNKTTGAYIPGMSFGGSPTFATPHKITVDEDAKKIVICDRSHHRRVWLDYDLNVSTLIAQSVGDNDASLKFPCQSHYHTDPVAGKVSVVAALSGSVGVYSETAGPGKSKLLSTIPVRQVLGAQGHTDPHDALFLPSGDIVVTCWKNPGTPGSIGTISYWKRL